MQKVPFLNIMDYLLETDYKSILQKKPLYFQTLGDITINK